MMKDPLRLVGMILPRPPARRQVGHPTA